MVSPNLSIKLQISSVNENVLLQHSASVLPFQETFYGIKNLNKCLFKLKTILHDEIKELATEKGNENKYDILLPKNIYFQLSNCSSNNNDEFKNDIIDKNMSGIIQGNNSIGYFNIYVILNSNQNITIDKQMFSCKLSSCQTGSRLHEVQFHVNMRKILSEILTQFDIINYFDSLNFTNTNNIIEETMMGDQQNKVPHVDNVVEI
jgi:hypothetical protein